MPDYLLVLFGLVLLVAAGEFTLRGTVGLARQLKISPAIIGLTVVGFGTSLPELVVGVQAAWDGRPGFAVGNAIGSNIANSLLILGAAATVRPLICEPRAVRRDGAAMIVATFICVAAALNGQIVAWQGLGMLALLVAFMAWSYWQDRKWADLPAVLHEREGELRQVSVERLPIVLVFTVGGLVGLVFGASIMVDGAASIGHRAGIPDAVLGLTLFAIGTSLPELVAAVVAAVRGHTDVAVGNVVGSNLFNILGILGAASLVAPLPIAPDIRDIDVWVLVGATAVLVPIIITGWRISRREGIILLACYSGYIASVFWRTGQA